MLKEEEVKGKIKSRTQAKKIELIVVRLISMILNAAIVGGSWVAIFYVNVYQKDISTYMSQRYKWLSVVSAFIPSVCLTIINSLLPIITNLLIAVERWDYQSSVINHQIWRNFLAKEFNIIIFFLINVDMIVPINIIENSNKIVTFNDKMFPCAEVQISIEFLKIVATEVVVYLVKHPIKFFVFWLFFECKDICTSKVERIKTSSSSFKPDIDISEVSYDLYVN